MGIFNWAMKGITMERKAVAEKAASAQTENYEVTLEQPGMAPMAYQPMQEPPMMPNYQNQAASVLFGETALSPYAPQNKVPQQYAPQPNMGFMGAMGGNTLGNRNILIITPRTHAEVMGIVEHLRTTGEAVIVTLDGIHVSEAQRRIDFLSGVVCAMNGLIRPLDTNKYILTPSGVGVKN